jgi:predicted DNA-binding protein
MLGCVNFVSMGHTISVRLSEELAAWLKVAAARSGVSQGRFIRDQLEKARASGEGFLRLAGAVNGPEDLSSRKLRSEIDA